MPYYPAFYYWLSILQASAQQAVLNRPVTVAVQDGTFSEAAGQIERQTGLMFLYKSDDIDRNRKISLNVRNRPLSEALDLLLRGTGLGYQISDRHITIGHVPARSSKPVTVTGKITDASATRLSAPTYSCRGRPTAPPRERTAASGSRHRRRTCCKSPIWAIFRNR